MNETLIVHDLTFELRRSSKRKNIGIIIDRRGELILAAPLECPQAHRGWCVKSREDRPVQRHGKANLSDGYLRGHC